MSTAAADVDALLADTARSLFARHSAAQSVLEIPAGDWSPTLWAQVEAAELPLIALSEPAGGSGGTVRQWGIVLRESGRWSAPIPLAETGVAGWLLEAAGLAIPPGPLSVARCAGGPRAVGAPYARQAAAVVLLECRDDGCAVALLPRGAFEVDEGDNIAGEPRDTVRFSSADVAERAVVRASTSDALRIRCAFVRSMQMVGAMDAVLEATLGYARERVQFGTPIARLGMVRERLVLLAEEVAAAQAAADGAIDGLAEESLLAVGAAKVRIGQAAGRTARLAHQVHGAIGITRELPLHLLTRRLWAWREEGGNERWWSERIGRLLINEGAGGLWPAIVDGRLPDAAR